MYEIWLATNILWELALMNLPWVLGYLTVLAVLLALALTRLRPLPWRSSLLVAAAVGAIVLVLSIFTVPGLIDSSVAELKYWVDWANLLGVAAGFGGAASILAWPLVALLKR